MANLGTFILVNNEYEKISELTGIVFIPEGIYEMQNLGEEFYIRIGEIGEGFIVKPLEKFIYQTNEDDIYIKPVYPASNKEKKINIAVFER